MEILAVEISGYDPVAGGAATLYVSGGTGFRTGPRDGPGIVTFQPRLQQGGLYERHLYGRGRTRGRSSVSLGEVAITIAALGPAGPSDPASGRGRRDDWAGWTFPGWPLVIRRGTPGTEYPAAWETVMSGVIEARTLTRGRITFTLRDAQALVADKLVVEETYLGDNALPNGREGTADDLKGQAKPQAYGGLVRNVSAPRVNTSKLQHQVARRAVQAIAVSAVTDKGAAIAFSGTAHATLALLEAATVTSNTYDTYLGSANDGAYFRLGTSSVGQVTADVLEGSSGTQRTAGQVARRLLTGPGGVPAGDVAGDGALDADSSAAVALWSGLDGLKLGEALDQVTGSTGAWWLGTRTGGIQLGVLGDLSGPSVGTIAAWQLLNRADALAEIPNEDGGQAVWRVTVQYDRNWTVQSPDSLAGIALATQDWRAREWRQVVAEDASIRARWPLATEITVTTLLVNAADAALLAAKLLARYRHGARLYLALMAEEQARRTDGTPYELGDLVTLTAPYHGLDTGPGTGGGHPFRVIGEQVDLQRRRRGLFLWTDGSTFA